ncbi:DUF4124 domain-containing protein [Colwellia psychrerythraea]|uniref:DUF4124 domain-containing protein n=1 Tax=Colwellia psychrerythraea TaxID=28229 RepID=A0A099KAH1_COLPS|nr:DUF4124 domain-containing protein [Colwellia psychrerythraea]KGJ87295.1 protein of unknown function DUF4124 [Colwellia psychrerythraea]
MDNLTRISIILLAASWSLPFSAMAEIYTWTDKSGKVHFSDKPISDEKVTTIKPSENNNIAKPVSSNSQWQQDYNKAKQAKAEKAQSNAKQKQKNKGYCNQLKSELALYQQGGRLYLMSADGERNYQSEEQLAEQKKRFTKLIKQNCR